MGPPPAKKPRKQIILDEDAYVTAIERIVERDFFPDIPKLQNRLEWLEAVRSRDPEKIRDAQMRIIQRRAQRARDGATPSLAGTPATGLITPASMMTGASPAGSLRSQPPGVQGQEVDGDQEGPDTNMSLDKFLQKYISEDNQSFSDITDKDKMHRYAKAAHLLELEAGAQKLALEGNLRPTDGYGTSNQPEATLLTWDYKIKNTLMYDSSERPDAPLTQQEKEQRAEGAPKVVAMRNTRFHGKVDDRQKEDETVAILYNPITSGTPIPFADRAAARAREFYNLEEMRRTPVGAGAGGEGGVQAGAYSMVVTPSPAPGVDESPFMTWGDIEGTPIRLEAEDTPIGIGGSSDGTHFKIPAPPPRDEHAHKLSRTAGRTLRERTALRAPSPSPARHGAAASPAAAGGLSSAAQKLVSKAIAKSQSRVDSHLRATYTATPKGATPKAAQYLRDGSLPLRSPSATPTLR
eukprot:jgi/Mesen1/1404/ME000130S00494